MGCISKPHSKHSSRAITSPSSRRHLSPFFFFACFPPSCPTRQAPPLTKGRMVSARKGDGRPGSGCLGFLLLPDASTQLVKSLQNICKYILRTSYTEMGSRCLHVIFRAGNAAVVIITDPFFSLLVFALCKSFSVQVMPVHI
jgi:hypothetical protein